MRPRMSKIWDGTRARFAKASVKDLVGPGLWLTAFLVLFALPCLFSSPGATRVQWQGMFFQCAGVLLVAWGLADTRHRLFHKTPPAERTLGPLAQVFVRHQTASANKHFCRN